MKFVKFMGMSFTIYILKTAITNCKSKIASANVSLEGENTLEYIMTYGLWVLIAVVIATTIYCVIAKGQGHGHICYPIPRCGQLLWI